MIIPVRWLKDQAPVTGNIPRLIINMTASQMWSLCHTMTMLCCLALITQTLIHITLVITKMSSLPF